MESIINYLIIGVFWMLILEWINNIKIDDIEDISLDLRDRIFNILFWPISVIIFIKTFFTR